MRAIPRKHPEAPTFEDDLANLKTKVEAGAEFLVSQLFFDNERFFEFERRAQSVGIDRPILPGIMPITNFDQIERFVAMCGASIPPKLRVEMEGRKGDSRAVEEPGRRVRLDAGDEPSTGGCSWSSLLYPQPFAGDACDRVVVAGR